MEARRTKRIHGIGLPFHAGTWPVRLALRLALRLVLLVGQRVDAASPGEVVAWGASPDGQTSVPRDAQSGVVTVAAGFSHPVALRSEGSSRRRSISYGHVPLLDRTRLLPARSMAPAPRPSRCRCGSPSYRPRICRRWWRWSHRPGRPSKNSFSRRLHPGSPRRCRWNPGRSSTGSANGRHLPSEQAMRRLDRSCRKMRTPRRPRRPRRSGPRRSSLTAGCATGATGLRRRPWTLRVLRSLL